jgi:hypothetical protein
MAALGGLGLGVLSNYFSGDSEQERLRRQKETALKQYRLGAEYNEQQYAINRSEAQAQAFRRQGRLAEQVGQSVDQFNLGLLSQAYGIQNAQIQTASNTGASLAAEGMSGTRGNNTGGLMRDYELINLDRNIELQRQGNNLSLLGMLSRADNAAADIERERASWDLGGYRYEQKQAQNEYNRQIAELGQEDFDWQIAQAGASWLDYFTGAFQGGMAGLNLWNTWNQAAQYTSPAQQNVQQNIQGYVDYNIAPKNTGSGLARGWDTFFGGLG